MQHVQAIPKPDNTPRTVSWSDVGEFDKLDERVSAVCVLFGSVIGVNDGSIEWCPDVEPPTEQERLAWISLCWPHLDAQLSTRVHGNLRRLIRAYRSGALQRWWRSPHA